MTSSMFDLIVVGGGPAGSAAAITAVRGGARVLVLERGRFPRHKVCGEFESRAVINASGRWSILNGTTAVAEQKWVGLKAHFAESSPEASVDLYFFDGGYCGVQPVARGRVNACAMVRADVASTLDEVFEQHGALRKRSRSWKLLIDPVSTSPLIFREPQPEREGILLAGDAAGFVDPFAGDGISLALRSGAMAAKCLTPFFAGETSLGQANQQYRSAYQRSLLPVFRASSQLRRLLTLPRPARRPLLLVLEKSPKIAEYLVRRTRKAPLEPGLPHHQHFTHIVAG